MKTYVFITLMFFCSFLIFSQENDLDTPLQFPFEETGIELPRGVYGSDDRKEVKDAEGIEDFVRATAVMISKRLIKDNKVYGYTLRERLTRKFASSNFDKNVKFLDQPTSAQCTGFLIAPDILVTAGHCSENLKDTEDYVWIFDYTNEIEYYPNKKYIDVDPSNIYEVTQVLDAQLSKDDNKLDYAVLKLDRKSSRAPYRFRTSGKINNKRNVNTIGSPTGLPLKFTTNAVVIDNSAATWFRSNIDSFPGNSGGPVFDPNGFIEGIHVRGSTIKTDDGSRAGDYLYDYECECIKTVTLSGAYYGLGAQAHRITSIPYELLHEAIYDNLEYAIENNLNDRFNSWMAYSWITDHDYTNKRGRLEFTAAKNNNLNALKLIVENSKNESLDTYGHDLMIYAINNNNSEMVTYLNNQVSFLEILDDKDQSPLFYAFNNNKMDMVFTLLNDGWDENSLDASGNNLLHLAAYKNDLSLIKKLSSKNINAGKKNMQGKLPENIAKRKKNKSISKYLKKLRKKQK